MTEVTNDGGMHHPPMEQIAALLDGRLSEGERGETLAHLDACADCFETYAETARFLTDEDSSAAGRARILRHRAWGRRPVVLALLAAAAIISILVIIPARWAEPPRLDSPTLAAALPPASRLAPSLTATVEAHGWSEQRTDSGAPGSAQQLSFQLGVRSLEMEVALAGGDAKAAHLLSHKLEGLLGSLDSAEPLIMIYSGDSGIRASLERGEQLSDLLQLQRRADVLVRAATASGRQDLSVDWYDLGRWAAAAELAAAAGDRGFFESRTSRVFLHRISRHLPSETRESLLHLRRLTAGPVDDEIPRIGREVDRLIRSAGGSMPRR